MTVVGIDIGAKRKGFHAAAIQNRTVVSGPRQLDDVAAVLRWIQDLEPFVVALDGPKTCAPPGKKSRAGERALMKEICGIRFTPEEIELDGNPYYEWIVCGRELYAALERNRRRRAWEVIEVFPTASWTVWAGPRDNKTRANWTQEKLDALELAGLPSRRLNQDDRDALAAALTARLYVDGRTRAFGDIEVPKDGEQP